MGLERREQLIRVAREYDALIITDDVYDQLQWPASSESMRSSLETAVQPRLIDIDRQLDDGPEREGADGFGNSVSNGSFSKIAGPGCRTGWAEGSRKFSNGLSQVYVTKPCSLQSNLRPMGRIGDHHDLVVHHHSW